MIVSLRVVAAAVVAGVLLAWGAGQAAAAEPDWRQLRSQILDVWQQHQLADGDFYDPIKQRKAERYSQSMFALALLLDGRVEAALRSAGFIAGLEGVLTTHPSSFEIYALASFYNQARRKLADHPGFVAIRPQLERWLQQIRPIRLGDRRRYDNRVLVEALAWQELVDSGLTSTVEGAVLSDPHRARRQVFEVLEQMVPEMARRTTITIDGQTVTLWSDPPKHPLAYHAFSAAWLARNLAHAGRSLPRARRLLVAMVEALVILTAPDGDLAYSGRSQEQAWALASAIYAAGEAARYRPGRAGVYRELARRLARRLQRLHPVGAHGIATVPLFARRPLQAQRAVDPYAHVPTYNALTAVILGWIAEQQPITAQPVSRKPLGVVKFPFAQAGMTIIDQGRFWMAIRHQRTTFKGTYDLRTDVGPIAAKQRTAGGWVDILYHRPRTIAPTPDSMGPLLLGRRLGLAYLTASHTRKGRAICLRGGFRDIHGRVLRRGVRFCFVVTGRGVRLAFTARAGDRIRLSTFRLPNQSSARLPGKMSRRKSYFNPIHGRLIRLTSVVQANRRGEITAVLR